MPSTVTVVADMAVYGTIAPLGPHSTSYISAPGTLSHSSIISDSLTYVTRRFVTFCDTNGIGVGVEVLHFSIALSDCTSPFFAVTLNSYTVPFLRPLTVAIVADTAVYGTIAPLGPHSTSYIFAPSTLSHVSIISVSPTSVIRRFVTFCKISCVGIGVGVGVEVGVGVLVLHFSISLSDCTSPCFAVTLNSYAIPSLRLVTVVVVSVIGRRAVHSSAPSGRYSTAYCSA